MKKVKTTEKKEKGKDKASAVKKAERKKDAKELIKKSENPYNCTPSKIIEKQKFSEDTYFFRIKTNMNPKPGQFIQIYVPLYGEVPISVASNNEKYLDLLIRNVGNVTKKLVSMEKEDDMLVRGPYGNNYPMKDLTGNNILIVAGGTGTAPVRGVIEYIENNRDDFNDVHIFLGFRNPENVLFKKDTEKWRKKHNLLLTVDKANTVWHGHTGVVTKYLEESGLNNENKIVFLCGPPIMIKFAIQTLKKMGFNDNQIFISMERQMKCGIGKCGHCMIHGKYTCKDGPVFRYDEISDILND